MVLISKNKNVINILPHKTRAARAAPFLLVYKKRPRKKKKQFGYVWYSFLSISAGGCAPRPPRHWRQFHRMIAQLAPRTAQYLTGCASNRYLKTEPPLPFYQCTGPFRAANRTSSKPQGLPTTAPPGGLQIFQSVSGRRLCRARSSTKSWRLLRPHQRHKTLAGGTP